MRTTYAPAAPTAAPASSRPASRRPECRRPRARRLSCFAFFRPALVVFKPASTAGQLTCRAFSAAVTTSGVSVAMALSQLCDAASIALAAVGCTRSRAAVILGPTVELVSCAAMVAARLKWSTL
ncbi:hypothetical protein ACFQFC_24520 [Amorphoplanes digitatis]|uniref:hypothetical protein n=1 Tax=Actinoplanes digitatis TaxID=1868 RepID=UPI0036079A73